MAAALRRGRRRGLRRDRPRRACAGMRAVAGRAVDLGDALDAELLPSCSAMRTDAAASIMVLHDALADPRLLFRHAGADVDHYAARLVATDHRMIRHLEAERRGAAGRTIIFEIAAAHPGGFYLQHDLAGPRRGIRKVEDLYPAVARENHALHVTSWP